MFSLGTKNNQRTTADDCIGFSMAIIEGTMAKEVVNH